MPIVRLLSSVVVLAKPASAVLRWARPTSVATRVLFLLLGICLAIGGVGAHQDGQDGWAVGLIAVGLALALSRRPKAPMARPIQGHVAQEGRASVPLSDPPDAPPPPSERLRAGWCRSSIAEDRVGKAVFPAAPTAVAWSLLGAMAAAMETNSPDWRRYAGCLEAVLSERYGGDFRGADKLREWSGAAHRTHAEVVSVAAEAERRVGAST